MESLEIYGVRGILQCLDSNAESISGALAYRFMPDREGDPIEVTHAALRDRALAVAGGLISILKPSDRVLILLPSGLEFVYAFLGCLYAGVIAVPLYPPRPNQNFNRLAAIHSNAAPSLAIATAAQLPALKTRYQADIQEGQVIWVDIESLLKAPARRAAVSPRSNDVAFIQYTSGSTAAPKGVVLTHGNIAHNQAQIQRAFRHDGTDHVMGWLPAFHDMGLIGNILQPLYLGVGCTLMPHLSFLQKPCRWLHAISRYQATTSGGPNFAYQLCVQKVTGAEKEGLDLSSWRLAFCGAEVVRPDTLRQFVEAFESCGFDRSAFYPCYGLAEATLFVAGPAAKQAPRICAWDATVLALGQAVAADAAATARSLVSCGRTFSHDVRIVDPDTSVEKCACHIGEIWVRSGSVAGGGYWRNDLLTNRVFGGHIVSDTNAAPFLRTGDLGFLDDEGDLFVTGRIKDLIIVRGLNHAPTDIESTAEKCHAAFRQGGCAAFSIDVDGEERLVLAQEIERTQRQFDAALAIDAVRENVTRAHGLNAHDIVFVRYASLPRTSSGKLQRYLCAQRYLEGSLDAFPVRLLVAASPSPDGRALETTQIGEAT